VIEKVYFPDHYSFSEEELKDILISSQANTLLVTRKDAVKMKNFALKLSFLELDIALNEAVHQSVQEYVKIA
jgi:tetraacyldisaccharide 4'-kinase